MSYVKDNLMPNEEVLYSARIHPALFSNFAFSCLFTIAIAIYTFSTAGQASPINSLFPVFAEFPYPYALLCVFAFFVLISIRYGLNALIVMFTTEFAVTNRRVVAKTGFIRRHTLEMLLTKIESVSVQQSMTGRMLNFGTVTVTGTGGTKESFQAIAEPLVVRKKINEIIEENTHS